MRDWYRGEGMEWTYRVGAGVLLLGRDNGALALGGVERGLAPHHRLAGLGLVPRRLPIIHCAGVRCLVFCVRNPHAVFFFFQSANAVADSEAELLVT